MRSFQIHTYRNIKFYSLVLVSICLHVSIRAQTHPPEPSDLIINISGRESIALDGKWHAIIDPYEVGYLNYRLKPYADSKDSFAGNKKPANKTDRIEYDFDKSPLVNVPGDWNSQHREWLYYEGTMWYKKSFVMEKDPAARVFAYFGAANYEANVYLNGDKIGDHTGGFTPFNLEITDKIRSGENFLVVRVNNARKREAVPTVNTDWWNYGGLTRSVKLVEVPKTFIQDYHIQLKKGSLNEIEGWVRLNGEELNQNITIEIPEARIKESFQTNENGIAQIKIKSRLTLWSPENPKLYKVVISSPNYRLEDNIGFRSIAVKGQDILLNGKEVFLRGVCIHEEAPYRTGRAFSEEDAKTLLGWAREMGCNFVRLAHYPHNENMIKVADRMGMMVWSEIPVYWTILWDNQQTYDNAQRQLEEVINRDRNRASVVLWSMANETPLSESRLTFISNLAKHTKKLDDTRLVTAALEVHIPPDRPNTVILEDPLAQYLDVYGCNEYFGWYVGSPSKADTMRWEMKYEKPLIISEFGGGSLQGYHGDKDERWTEEYQAAVYRHNINMFKNIPFLKGTTPWILMDFRSPKRVLPGIQDGWNRKGLLSDQGVHKEAFKVMQQWYEEIKKRDKK